MIIALIPLLVAIAGVLAYALATNAKIVEIGRLAFASGLLVTLLHVGTGVIRIGP